MKVFFNGECVSSVLIGINSERVSLSRFSLAGLETGSSLNHVEESIWN